jgi:hypothetical protein
MAGTGSQLPWDDLPDDSNDVKKKTPPHGGDGVTFRIQRVQKLTLTAVIGTLVSVIGAAVSLGIQIGSYKEKIDRIDKFVDIAGNESTGIFVRLATLQKAIDDMERISEAEFQRGVGSPARESQVDLRIPAVDLKIPTIQVQSNSAPAPQSGTLTDLAEIKVAEEMLRSGTAQASPGTPSPALPGAGSPPPDSLQQQALLMDELKQDILTNLDVMEGQVKGNKKMSSALRDQLITIIDRERVRVNSLKTQPPPQTQPAIAVTDGKK